MNPKGLVIAGFIWLISITNLSRIDLLLINLALVLLIFLFGQLGLGRAIKKLLLVIPFISLIALAAIFNTDSFTLSFMGASIQKVVVILLRAITCLLVVTGLISHLGARQFLYILQEFRLPPLFIQLADFILRYLGVMQAELTRMQLARKARNYNFQKSIFHGRTLRTLTQLLGILFLRTFKRGEQVHLAMMARGYKGGVQMLPSWQKTDGFWLTGLLIAWNVILLLLDKGCLP